MARNKAIINPATGAKIREFFYVFEVEELETGKLTNKFYIFVTDEKVPPMIWNNHADDFQNARPALAEEFLKNGSHWYDFSEFCGNLDNVKKIDPPSGDAPEGYKLHIEYRLDVSLTPGVYYDVGGGSHPYEWQVKRWNTPKEMWVCVKRGTTNDIDTAIVEGRKAFDELKI